MKRLSTRRCRTSARNCKVPMSVFSITQGTVCRCAALTISDQRQPDARGRCRFSDARCRACAPPDGERWHAARGLRASGGGLAQMQAPEGTLISYASQPGTVAQDGADGDSPYTKALAATMRTPGLDIFQTCNEVGLQVKRATGGSQQPWVASSPIEGTFFFAAPQETATAVRPASPPAVSETEPELVRLPEAAPAEAPRPRSVNESCSRLSNMIVYASSVLPPAHGNVYGPDNLLDGNDATAWVEGSSGQSVDDYLVLEFDALQSVNGLTIRNGYDKNSDIYGKNSRVQDVELRFSTGDRLETTLKDDPAPQHVALSRPIQAKWVQLIVRSVYPGWKYSDTAFNEVRVDVQ